MSAESSGKISLALGASKKASRPAPTNGVKRSHAALHDHDEDEIEHGKAQTVSHFDKTAGGAIDENKVIESKAPLTIIPQANRDWKEASQRNKRQRSDKLDEIRQLENGHKEDLHLDSSKPSYGLIVRKRTPERGPAETNGHATLDEAEQSQEVPPEPNGDVSIQEKTEDELALDALLGKSAKQGLVLPMMTEEEAFERDFKEAPDMASLEDYARVPVEEFGAAMLRGMGWKEGEGIGSNRGKKVEKTKIPERRPALLGIGAKEEAAVAQEMGTWGKAAKDRKGQQPQIYNPVLLRDKKTGELFTEEELEKKKAQDERENYEVEFEREEKRKEKEMQRRDRDDSRERVSDRRGKDHRRERSRDDRDRRKYDSDVEYYRRKEKDRRRKERDRGDSDRDRSRRYDSDRDRHRDRHRDRR